MVKDTPSIPRFDGHKPHDLPTLLGKNIKFLSAWADLNEEEFSQVMKVLAKEQPAKFADVYLKVAQTIAPKTNATYKKTDVTYHHIDTDMAKIKSLAGMKVNASEQLEAPGKQTEYKDYEEIKEPVKKFNHKDILD